MIYFFDNELNMVKVATSKNIISAVHEHELNGLILGTVETDLSYTEAFINDVDYFGYYYKGNYHLHKIKRVEHEHENELVRITGRHIFFEDMLYGDYIRDVRPVNRDALYILNQTISANTRWQTVMTDTSKLHSETYYWVPPMEVLNDLTENVGIEYEPKILFDGQKINGFQLHVANRIGEDTPIRVPFGSRVINLKYEVDYSEIVTALYGHGKGEEVGDGYGRRINFSSVNFSRNGVVSPTGQLYMENPNVTAQYGKDDGSPKFGRIIFEDIESASELANATYEAYLEQSRPKMLFEASVVDLGDVGMGDGVLIIRREYDVYFNARIHKLMVDLLDAENADVELGDYAHFKESKVQRKTRESNNQYRRETSSRIQQLKEQFNERFDGEVNQMREDFEQALIDAHAEIQAAEQRMEALITTTRNDWTDTFNAEVAEIYRKANEDYNRIETEITGVIDSTRNEMETNFNSKVNDARTYAEQQAQEKANAVRTDLETVTSGHQSMLVDLESNVMNIDDFLGDISSITLDDRLQNINRNFEERIRNIDSNTYNMLRESRFDNTDFVGWSGGSIYRDESIPYYKNNNLSVTTPWVSLLEMVTLESGKEYILSFDFRSESVPESDYIWFTAYDDGGGRNLISDSIENTLYNLPTDGEWRRVYLRFTAWRGATGRIRIGSRFNVGNTDAGEFSIRLPYLTSSSNKEWVYHPLDATQSIEEVTRRITNLEDGRKELITRTEWDSESDYIMQTVRDIEETVDVSRNLIQDIQDYEIIQRGSEAIQTVDGFNQKVWLNDFAEIGANLIPQSSNAWENGTFWTSGTNNNNSGGIRTKDYIEVIPGERYTFQDESAYVSSIKEVQIAQWDGDTRIGITAFVNRGSSHSFTAQGDRIRIGLTPMSGFGIEPRFVDHIDERIKMKLEKGGSATPFMNALSRVEQLADSYSVQVAELDGTYLKQSELKITPEYAQIGSMRIDGDTVGSMLRVSPDGIDAVAEAMRLSGDLFVAGDVEALAVSAIEGEFARLWADEFSAITIDVDDIQGLTARFEYLYTLNANIERLVSQNVFANGVNALVGNFVDVNAGSIVTSGLSANIIKSEHIAVGTALIDKMFATSARIDRLITKTHFVNEIKATSIDAVYANISDLRTKLLTANVITSNHIKVENALIDKMFASTALIERLTSKSAFIRDIQAIEITANQLNLTTLTNRINQIEGGLRITRPDGVDWVRNGQARGHVPVQVSDGYAGADIRFNGTNFITGSSTYQTMKYFYTPHEGTRLRVVFAVGLFGGPSGVEFMHVRVRGFSGYNPINMGLGSSSQRVRVIKGETNYVTLDIPMAPPNYSEMAAYLEFRRDPDGQHSDNEVYARLLHIGQYE